MPADRFLHKRAGHGERSGNLSHLEWRVWTIYLLAADDFGVMWCDPAPLMTACPQLGAERPRALRAALERLVNVGLVGRFTHQGKTYLYQRDWNRWQKVTWPAETLHPKPPADFLENCDPDTRRLFSVHPGGSKIPTKSEWASSGSTSEVLQENFGSTFPSRETARAKANGSGSGLSEGGAGETIGRGDWFWAEWRRVMSQTRGIDLANVPKATDIPILAEICGMVAEDARLVDALERFMTLPAEQAKAWSVKVISPATFRMALPKLLEHAPSVGVTARTSGNVAALEAFIAKGQPS